MNTFTNNIKIYNEEGGDLCVVKLTLGSYHNMIISTHNMKFSNFMKY